MLAINDKNKNLLGIPFPSSPPENLPFILQNCSELFCSASPTDGLPHLPHCDSIVQTSILLTILLFMSVLQGRTHDSYSVSSDWTNAYPLHTLPLTSPESSSSLLQSEVFWSSQLLEKLLLYSSQKHTEKPSFTLDAWTNSICSLGFVRLGRDLSVQP